jgi:Dolichyl-phosphate-mannose-protein mannosyltransferase
MTTKFPWRALTAILLIALASRLILLASGAVSFHADEAIVALMARHINLGERPTFFYGQAYMGSLDAWLVAIGFHLMGESVMSVRVVQSGLYLLAVAVGFVTAWRLSGKVKIAIVAGLVMAIPPVNTALYTTATLGGYNETLIFGGLILLLGYEVTHDHRHSWWHWGLLGICGGLGWWINGLIVAYALPVCLLIFYVLIWRPLREKSKLSLPIQISAAVIGVLIGAAPWLTFDFTHDHAALAMFISNRQTGEFEGIGIPYVPPGQRAIGLAVIGLPTLIGMRFPWNAAYFLLPLGVLVLLIYVVAIFRLLRGNNPLKPDARGLVLGMLGLFCAIFIASTFGADPTGRYFLPMLLPLGIVLGALVDGSWSLTTVRAQGGAPLQTRIISFVLVLIVVGYQAIGQIVTMTTPPGLTTQFDPISHIPNDNDEALITFLDEKQLFHGYTNYWVAFRLAFLSGERMQYSSALPYKADLGYNAADNRYVAYQDATENAERIAYITTNLPALDERLRDSFSSQGIDYQIERIGPFVIYYDFDRRPAPYASE